MSDDSARAAPRPPLTLRVAITGHRTFTDDNDPDIEANRAAKIREAIAVCLRDCAAVLHDARRRNDIFSTDAATLTLVTALAEGADQIAVDAMRLTEIETSIEKRIEAVLPFCADDYASTMGAAAARNMRAIAGRPADGETPDSQLRADAVLSLDDTPPTSIADERERARFMDQRYAAVGDILSRQADILIAVWNGEARSATGGTSYVIGLALRQGLPVVWINRDDASMWWLETPDAAGDVLIKARQRRLAYSRDLLEAQALSILLPEILDAGGGPKHGEEQKEWKVAKRCFERFFGLPGVAAEIAPAQTRYIFYKAMMWLCGADISVRPATIDRLDRSAKHNWEWARLRARKVECDFVRAALLSGVPDAGSCQGLVRRIAPVWGYSDAIATGLGHRFRSTYVFIYGVGVLAVLVALAGAMSRTAEPSMAILEVIIIFAGLLAHYLSTRNDVHERFLSARGISEEMRPSWALARLGLAGRHVLRPGAPWTAWAIQSWTAAVGLPDQSMGQSELLLAARDILAQILLDQKNYHIANAVRLKLLDRTLEAAGVGSFVLALIAMIGVVVAGWYDWDSHLYMSETGASFALLFGAGLPAIGAAIAGLRHQGDFEQFARRSAQTARELDRLEKEFQDFIARLSPMEDSNAPSPPPPPYDAFAALRDMLLDLERVLRDDLDDWRFVYQSRPTPHPG